MPTIAPFPNTAPPAPALRQPDLLAPGDQLQREQHRDDLEYVGRPAGRERQRGHPEQDDEEDREALLLEELDQAAEGLLACATQEAFERVARESQLVLSR